VVNGIGNGAGNGSRKISGYAMTLAGATFRNLADPSLTASAADFVGMEVHAVAGIGNPQRFFDHLRGLGLKVAEHPFPDHHRFRPEDLDFPGANVVLMTEKDAVKCAAFAAENCWMLAVEAHVDAALGEKILEKLRKTDGRQTA
jgi:tetraacyldisaccharide 4'-kinase